MSNAVNYKNAHAQKSSDPLSIPMQYLPTVGPKRAPLFERLGVQRPIDLLFFFPRSYQEPTPIRSIRDLQSDVRATLVGVIEAIELRAFPDGGSSLGVLLAVDGGYVRLVWFNQGFRYQTLSRGMRLAVTGIPKPTGVSWQMKHPEYQILERHETPPPPRPLPVYRLTDGLQQKHIRSAMEHAIEKLIDTVGEVLPFEIREQHKLIGINDAIRQIHFPRTMEEVEQARRRFIFQELFVYQLAIAMRRQELKTARPAPVLAPTGQIHARILRRFPFELNDDQRRAIRDVGQDMATAQPMNRLIQGDVGSGKTVIAQYAMLLAVAHRYQAALMAPTEVLARQHATKLAESLRSSHVHVELLVGSMSQRERTELLQRIALGTVDLVIGTQALLSDEVEFANLGLVVIDEQHKFGVQQRASLRTSRTQPHYLVLSATPIPRTITMTAMGDLDVSILREKPPGRAAVHTYLGQPEQADRWWSFVLKQVKDGRQAYVIAPRVTVQDDSEIANAEAAYRSLQAGPLRELAIGLLHGRMDSATKQQVLEDFMSGEIQVLVATTVVEVGIDVANATVMTILDGDRLGLAQLHQLRGRVSRSVHPGYVCVFPSRGPTNEDNARLKAFVECSDGFELAELDLKMRGPGDLLGTQQSGLPSFRIADLVRDADLVVESRTAATELLARDAGLESAELSALRRQTLRRHGDMLVFSDVG